MVQKYQNTKVASTKMVFDVVSYEHPCHQDDYNVTCNFVVFSGWKKQPKDRVLGQDILRMSKRGGLS